ncbi:hypothetical protein JTE90_021678 [Oedothorax gibbosus]|uniref:Uncharacterized protein n=1 Tax=Oedothorax gibbosus TaxID=931172 RepID=A0AAV6TN44_9ARAC|nr:hypothetical protein JTE90_021678 [Oedothorax gibbosus]
MSDQQRIGVKLSAVCHDKPNVTFDVKKCIICQAEDNNKTVTTVNGRKRVQEAASIRNDIVEKRLKTEKANVAVESENDIANDGISRKSRSSVVPRETPSSIFPQTHIRCIVCGLKSNHGIREKFRISESERAKHFLSATIYFQDDVYTRVADLESDTQVFGEDIMYHKSCLEAYFRKYEYAIKKS